ncbi:hypothetical protein TNCV_3539931 [Trichonephila clavipes]|nr:hypothetical protein TNCV_3539931 [Trichonephila clavipes]
MTGPGRPGQLRAKETVLLKRDQSGLDRRPCPYYLRSRLKKPEGISEEQRDRPQNKLRRRSLRRRSGG